MKVRGARETAKDYRKASKELRSAVADGVEEAAGICLSAQRGLCPTETGTLRDSGVATKAVPTKEGARATTEWGDGIADPYVAAIEWGSAHNLPQPFVRPGFEKTKKRSGDAIRDHVCDAIDESS